MEEKQLKYYKMHHDLEEQIHRGELRAGDRVPSENQLAAAYQVSRQTVRKALAILEQEGYIYAMHGKGTFVSERLRPGHKSHNIAVVTTYLSDYIFPRVIQGIDDVLTAEGYSILLKNTHNSRSQEARCLEELLQKDIDGVIIEPSKSQISCRHLHLYEQLESYGIPYVFIQGCFDRMEDRPQVLMDDCRGGYMITKYLLDNGHRSIAGIFKADDIQGQNRHRGYVQALQEAGMLYDPDKVIWFHTEDRKVHPREGILRLLAKGISLDAVVCYNDQIAMQIIPALASRGIRVPEDISVTGYDNSCMAMGDGFHLTTIVHPQEKLGEMAAQLLLSLLRGETLQPEQSKILIQPELVVGNSCCSRLRVSEEATNAHGERNVLPRCEVSRWEFSNEK